MKFEEYTLKKLEEIAAAFVKDRKWEQFHNPKNDAMNLVREATELAELFIWTRTSEESFEQAEKLRSHMEDEVGDVFFALLCFCYFSKIDLKEAFLEKIKKSEKKYPIENSSYEKFNKIKYGKE